MSLVPAIAVVWKSWDTHLLVLSRNEWVSLSANADFFQKQVCICLSVSNVIFQTTSKIFLSKCCLIFWYFNFRNVLKKILLCTYKTNWKQRCLPLKHLHLKVNIAQLVDRRWKFERHTAKKILSRQKKLCETKKTLQPRAAILGSVHPVCSERSGFDLAQVMTTGRRTNHVYVHHISAWIRHRGKPGQPEASPPSSNQPGTELTAVNQWSGTKVWFTMMIRSRGIKMSPFQSRPALENKSGYGCWSSWVKIQFIFCQQIPDREKFFPFFPICWACPASKQS